jgi:hypothetical protein
MILIVAVLLAFGVGFLIRPFVYDDRRQDLDHVYGDHRHLTQYDD